MSELTSEEQAVVEKLATVSETKKVKYSFDDNFQRRILGLILTDRNFLVQAKSLIEPEYFSNESHVLIATALYQYFETYNNSLPEKFVLQKLVEEKIKDRSEAIKIYYQTEFESLYEAFIPSPDSRDILLDKVLTFAKMQVLRIAMDQSMKDMKKDPENEETWNKIYERFRQAMTVNKNFDVGFEAFININDFFAELQKETTVEDKFTSGFSKIDNNLSCGGCRRGEIYAWIGMPGKGKSLCLVKACVENIRQGKKVLYVSLEQGYVDITKRFLSQFSLVNPNTLVESKASIQKDIEMILEGYEDKNRFVIKQFPSGQADVDDIKAYLTQMELKGFKPDLLIVDYPGEMRDPPGMPTWESKYRIMRDLRGIAIEKNMCVFTAMQPNKNAAMQGEAEFIDEGTIGGSFDQVKPLDGLWSINQTNAEAEAGYARYYVVKHRSGNGRFSFPVFYDKKYLDIRECTEGEYRMAMHNLANNKANAANINNTKKSKGSGSVEIKLGETEESDYAD